MCYSRNSLEFLNLAFNRIERLENIEHLQALRALNLGIVLWILQVITMID
jgi:hypothetical protein